MMSAICSATQSRSMTCSLHATASTRLISSPFAGLFVEERLTYEIPFINAIGPRRLETKGLDEANRGVIALDDPAENDLLRATGAHAPPQLRKRRRGNPGSEQSVTMP